MQATAPELTRPVYTVVCPGGTRYVIFNASALWDPTGYEPGKWYAWRYPVAMGFAPAVAYDTSEDAERAAMAGLGEGRG